MLLLPLLQRAALAKLLDLVGGAHRHIINVGPVHLKDKMPLTINPRFLLLYASSISSSSPSTNTNNFLHQNFRTLQTIQVGCFKFADFKINDKDIFFDIFSIFRINQLVFLFLIGRINYHSPILFKTLVKEDSSHIHHTIENFHVIVSILNPKMPKYLSPINFLHLIQVPQLLASFPLFI